METMSNWVGFDADKMDLEARSMSVGAVEQFYNLFWKPIEPIDEIIGRIDKVLGTELPF